MNVCATRCFVKKFRLSVKFKVEHGYCFLLHVCEHVSVWMCECVCFMSVVFFSDITRYPSIKLPFVLTFVNTTFALVNLLLDPHNYLHVTFFMYGKSKYPLPAFFLYVLGELKMHLLPVVNCEWRAFDIMRGLVQYKRACASMLPLLISAKRCGPIFTAL